MSWKITVPEMCSGDPSALIVVVVNPIGKVRPLTVIAASPRVTRSWPCTAFSSAADSAGATRGDHITDVPAAHRLVVEADEASRHRVGEEDAALHVDRDDAAADVLEHVLRLQLDHDELLRERLAIDAGLLQPRAEVGDAERGDREHAELEDDREAERRALERR